MCEPEAKEPGVHAIRKLIRVENNYFTSSISPSALISYSSVIIGLEVVGMFRASSSTEETPTTYPRPPSGDSVFRLKRYLPKSRLTNNGFFPPCAKRNKQLLLEHSTSALEVPVVNGIWEVANYFKHRDEWTDWNPKRRTVQVLTQLGLSSDMEFPLIEAGRSLQGGDFPLVGLLRVASNWRAASVLAYK